MELVSISATLCDSVFADLSVVFPFGLSRSFPKLCDPQRPTKTIWKPGFTDVLVMNAKLPKELLGVLVSILTQNNTTLIVQANFSF